MSLGIFERKFGKNPRDFGSVKEINEFIEAKIGRKLKVREIHPGVCGATLSCCNMDADKIIDKALNK